MKFSNFKLIKTEGTKPSNKVFIAEVDVETGVLFWKKKTRRKIMRQYGGYWFFCDNGKFTTGCQVENLARVWTAETGEET